MRQAICPACGRSDAVVPSPERFSHSDLIGTALFGWLGYWSALSERRSVLRCGHCGCRFRKPTGFLVAALVWLVPVAILGAGTFIGVTAAVNSAGIHDRREQVIVSALLE